MLFPSLLLACAAVLVLTGRTAAVEFQDQKPLLSERNHSSSNAVNSATRPGRKPHGRFLQISDIHPDPFYKINSSTDASGACHRGQGSAGYYGAEKTECDAPFSLINATFQWVAENLKDTIDFVIWTGDSARHDNDEEYPRSEEQVLGLNQLLVDKFVEVFGSTDTGRSGNTAFRIPIIPTFGNNDILPHNIFSKGPNTWTKRYAQLWSDFVPEEQRHAFGRGGWFYVEVIPNKLAVFSLNTLYFFDSNSAVDGCGSPTEPGYEHMEWLRIQLAFLRQRRMKAILTGHVPPARSPEKSLWDESCWQKYAIWMQQYRDVIVGSIFGHMNVEHFLLQDFHDIDYDIASGTKYTNAQSLAETYLPHAASNREPGLVEIKVNAPNYINSLRQMWAKLPTVPGSLRADSRSPDVTSGALKDTQEQRDFYSEIGGRFAERFSVAIVAASVVPNYFPALRVYEYNTSGLEDPRVGILSDSGQAAWHGDLSDDEPEADVLELLASSTVEPSKARPKKPRFTVPDPPTKRSPPGPAYSPQTLSWLGYKQYYANLTRINANVKALEEHGQVNSKNRSRHREHSNFYFEIEYDTRDVDDIYLLRQGLTVKEWVKFAATIGDWRPQTGSLDRDRFASAPGDDSRAYSSATNGTEDEIGGLIGSPETVDDIAGVANRQLIVDLTREDILADKHKNRNRKKKKKPSKKRKREIEETWFAFTSRAVVGTLSRDELREKFG